MDMINHSYFRCCFFSIAVHQMKKKTDKREYHSNRLMLDHFYDFFLKIVSNILRLCISISNWIL